MLVFLQASTALNANRGVIDSGMVSGIGASELAVSCVNPETICLNRGVMDWFCMFRT